MKLLTRLLVAGSAFAVRTDLLAGRPVEIAFLHDSACCLADKLFTAPRLNQYYIESATKLFKEIPNLKMSVAMFGDRGGPQPGELQEFPEPPIELCFSEFTGMTDDMGTTIFNRLAILSRLSIGGAPPGNSLDAIAASVGKYANFSPSADIQDVIKIVLLITDNMPFIGQGGLTNLKGKPPMNDYFGDIHCGYDYLYADETVLKTAVDQYGVHFLVLNVPWRVKYTDDEQGWWINLFKKAGVPDSRYLVINVDDTPNGVGRAPYYWVTHFLDTILQQNQVTTTTTKPTTTTKTTTTTKSTTTTKTTTTTKPTTTTTTKPTTTTTTKPTTTTTTKPTTTTTTKITTSTTKGPGAENPRCRRRVQF